MAVTPCTGVWIEINEVVRAQNIEKSLPARECGLKFIYLYVYTFNLNVTPCTGVWIEIFCKF